MQPIPRQVRLPLRYGSALLSGSALLLCFCSMLVGCSESSPAGSNAEAASSETATTVTTGGSGSDAAVTTAASSGGLGMTTTGAQATTATSGGSTTNTGGGAGGAGQGSTTSRGTEGAGGAGGATTADSATATSGAGGTGTVVDPGAMFAAPNGTPAAAGTIDDPTTLGGAVERAAAGTVIYLRGGTYTLDSTHALGAAGSEDAPIELSAYPLDGERPLLDFSSMAEDSGNRGLSLSGDHWHVYGIDVFGAGDNCMFVSGSHNVIEHSTFSECADTGLQLGNGASDNLILNCDSYFNADASLENADGFAAKLDVGTGNRFVGCRAWNNLDDGWDGYLRPADNVTTTHENCWAIDNGKLQDGSVGAGDGNGFKTGGSDDKNLSHNASYTGCIATGNVHDGFDHNSNRGSVTILNSAAHDNGSNINFGTTNIAALLTIKNTLSLGSIGDLSASSTDITNNSWQDARAATADDFVSIDPSALKGPRKSDGSLPDIDYLRLTPSSDLRNSGVDIGLPYAGSAPDIGPFESDD
ncbi:MAG TPA: hypothetical protein VI197_26860 [Polyangiaceae bacterium]